MLSGARVIFVMFWNKITIMGPYYCKSLILNPKTIVDTFVLKKTEAVKLVTSNVSQYLFYLK